MIARLWTTDQVKAVVNEVQIDRDLYEFVINEEVVSVTASSTLVFAALQKDQNVWIVRYNPFYFKERKQNNGNETRTNCAR